MPPPNIYDPDFKKVMRSSPAPGLGYGEREKLNKTFNVPGPGNYQTPQKMGNEGPKFIMGMKIQDSISIKRAKEMPSPDLYNPDFSVVKKHTSIFSVGRA